MVNRVKSGSTIEKLWKILAIHLVIHGVRSVLSVNGSVFTNEEMIEFLKRRNIHQICTTLFTHRQMEWIRCMYLNFEKKKTNQKVSTVTLQTKLKGKFSSRDEILLKLQRSHIWSLYI